MDASHYHATLLTQMQRILRGIDDIPEMSAIVLQYSKIDDLTNATITEHVADIQHYAPAHHVALAQADSVCAVFDRAVHIATDCRTKALLFKNGRINPEAIDAVRHFGNDDRRIQRGRGRRYEARDRQPRPGRRCCGYCQPIP
jgi:hypothetical protein